MRVAVLMSTYNGENYLADQIESILSQQGDFTLSLLVRDDGSADGTARILSRYAEAGSLSWYQGENRKPAKSFLTLLRDNPGYDFYAFSDQDDLWDPDKLAVAISRLKDIAAPGVYCANARLVKSDLAPIGKNIFDCAVACDFYSRVCSDGVPGCTMVLNSALAQLVQGVPMPESVIMHDTYLLALCAAFDGTVIFDPAPHMAYRQHCLNAVGVKYTKLSALRDRWHRITKKEPVSIAQQAQSLLLLYPDIPDENKRAFLARVAGYRETPFRALSLALSRKPRYNSINMGLTIRLSLAFRKR